MNWGIALNRMNKKMQKSHKIIAKIKNCTFKAAAPAEKFYNNFYIFKATSAPVEFREFYSWVWQSIQKKWVASMIEISLFAISYDF